MLEIKELATAYGKIEALKGVSLQARAGEVTCLLGPNGAGKTTLMMTIAGILKPQRGSVTFEGEELVGLSPAEIVARGLALVPENRLVFPALTVRENLMAGAFSRRDRGAVKADADRMLDRFPRLRERIGQLAGTLSGGEQQMLAMARVLVGQPRLLLIDEPTEELAPMIVDEIFKLIDGLRREGVPILLVEQNLHRALDLVDRFYALERGTVVLEGRGDQAGDRASLVRQLSV